MTEIYKAEPYVKVVERSDVIIRAPRAVPRRMALTLFLGLAMFWIPMLIGGMLGEAALFAGIPLVLFLSTFRGANTLRLEPKQERLCIQRHYLIWSALIAQVKTTEVREVLVKRRSEEAYEESPLLPVSALLATFGVHAHFGGKRVYIDVLDLVLELASGDRLVVISSRDNESIETARLALARKLNLSPC